VLEKDDLDFILREFPSLKEKLREEAEQRLIEMILQEEKKIFEGLIEREDTIERDFKTQVKDEVPIDNERGSILKTLKKHAASQKIIEEFLMNHFEDEL
jgi:hypothetical protein